MEHIEEIQANNRTIAIIIYSEFSKDGIEFFTPAEFSQQLGYMRHKKGYKIQEHMHQLQIREVRYTQETLFLRKGRVRVDFYADDKVYLASRERLHRFSSPPLHGPGRPFRAGTNRPRPLRSGPD